jgi:CRP/FNR family transcriptional regulator
MRTPATKTIPVKALPAGPRADQCLSRFDGHSIKVACSNCNLRELCMPVALSPAEMVKVDAVVAGRRKVKRGAALFRNGEAFTSLFAIRSGFFKTSVHAVDGRAQVTGFQMAGEIIGLDGVASGNHASTARALEDADVCAIPYARLCKLANDHVAMQQLVTRLMSRELVREHGVMLLLGSMSAEERLAAFLLNLSRRYKARGYSSTEFHMRMSRAEIGSYLGLTLETVSRTFSTFQHHGVLEVDKRHIRIVDMERLAGRIDTPGH